MLRSKRRICRTGGIGLAAVCALLALRGFAAGATAYEEVPLTASDFTPDGYPLDTVSGNPFLNANNGTQIVPMADQGTGPALGGPSGSSSYFSSSEGYYGTPTGVNPPRTDFDLSIYAEASNTTQSTDLFSSNSDNSGSLQIGITGGDYVAYVDNGSNNSGTLIGAIAATTAATHLQVTDSVGTLEFLVDGVPVGTTSDSGLAGGWATEHLGLAPGGGTGFTGYLADLTITPVPEPTMFAPMIVAGAIGLSRRRKRRASTDL